MKASPKKSAPFTGYEIPPFWNAEEMKNRTACKIYIGNL